MTQRVLGVIGVGLIGGSLALAARRAGWHVLGYDCDAGSLKAACDVAAIDEGCSRDEVYARAHVVAVASHTDATIAEIRALQDERPAHPRAIFDVASVKEPVARAAGGLPRFVPTHPMAGTEHRGVRSARADLFDGRRWAYVPSGRSEAEQTVVAMIEAFGAIPVPVDAAEHDRIVALTSHLPQMIASHFAARLNACREKNAVADALCGPTALELQRLGRSSFAMWSEILIANSGNVAGELRELSLALTRAADAIGSRDLATIREAFALAGGS